MAAMDTQHAFANETKPFTNRANEKDIRSGEKGTDSAQKRIQVDENLYEQIEYQEELYPLSLYWDHLDEFFNGELACHWHNAFEVGILLKGELTYSLHQGSGTYITRTLRPGDGVFVNSKSLHRAEQTVPGTVMFDFIVLPEFFRAHSGGRIYEKNVVPLLSLSSPGLFLSREDPVNRGILDDLQALTRLSPSSSCYELSCVELVYRIWRQLFERLSDGAAGRPVSRAESRQAERMRAMLAYIHSHYGEPLTVASIAAAAHIGKSECFRCFHTIVQKTPLEYLCGYRLARAAHLLAHSDQSLTEICYSCGFGSNSYFGKVFRENTGMTPGEYRRSSVQQPD